MSSQGTYSQLKNYKQIDKIDLDIDSPCLKRAMGNLGISKDDITKKQREDFADLTIEESVVDLRFKHYQTRVIQTINRLLQERKKVKETVGPQLHLEQLAHMNIGQSTTRGSIIQAADTSRARSNMPKRRGGINGSTGSVVFIPVSSVTPRQKNMHQIQTERSSIIPKQDFFTQLNHETMKVERLKHRQEEIAILKLEKEAKIRQRNEELQKKYAKLEKFEKEYRQELFAKSIQMSQRREDKIKQMKLAEREKEKQLQREQEKLIHQLHEKAKNFTLTEVDRQKEIRMKEELNMKKREETLKKIESMKKQEMQQLEEKLQQIESKFKKGEENQKLVMDEKKARTREKNEMIVQQLMNFKEEKKKLDEEKYGQLGDNLLKLDQKIKKREEKEKKEVRDVLSQKNTEQYTRFKDAKRAEIDDMKQKQQQFEIKMKMVEQNLEQTKKEKDHEIKLKQEMRKLKEDDLKKAKEQKKRMDQNKKLEIIQKEKEHSHAVEHQKMQKELILQAKLEQTKQLNLEKKQIEEAISILTTLASKQAKEKYLKDNFEASFIEKLRAKVPMLLENDRRMRKVSDGDNTLDNIEVQ